MKPNEVRTDDCDDPSDQGKNETIDKEDTGTANNKDDEPIIWNGILADGADEDGSGMRWAASKEFLKTFRQKVQ